MAGVPPGARLVRRQRTVAASLIAVIVLFILVPIFWALSYALTEARQLIGWGIAANANGAPAPEWFATLPLVGDWATEQWETYIGRPGALGQYVAIFGGANVINIYQTVLAASGNVLNLALNLLFMIIALLFVYRDGASFADQLDKFGERILPVRWHRLSRVVPATISSTVTGMTLIAIGEGIVLGIAYWLAGAPSPVLLGVITGVAAMIPGGAALVHAGLGLSHGVRFGLPGHGAVGLGIGRAVHRRQDPAAQAGRRTDQAAR